jgi:hypothetical protein
MNKLSYISIIIVLFMMLSFNVKCESGTINRKYLSKTKENNIKDYLDFIGYFKLQPVFRNRKDDQVVKLGANNELIKILDSSYDYEPIYYCDYGYCKVSKTNRKQIIIHLNNYDYKFKLPSEYSSPSFSSKMDTMFYDDTTDGVIKYYIIKTNKTVSTQIKGYGPILVENNLYFTRSYHEHLAGDVEVTLLKSKVDGSHEAIILDDVFESGWHISPDSGLLLYCLGDGYRLYNIRTKLQTILNIELGTNFNIVFYDFINKHFVFMNGSNFSMKIIN